METGNLYIEFIQAIAKNIYNDHKDNYDHLRFGDSVSKKRQSWRSIVKRFLNSNGYYNKAEIRPIEFLSEHPWIEDFEYLYYLLEEETDRKLLIYIMVFRLLGHTKVKLPLNNAKYWEQIQLIQKHENRDDFIQIKFLDFKLFYNDLNYLNFPIKLYFATAGIHVDFLIRQYDYKNKNVSISVQENDVVIDAGGCFGDTALYFSFLTGASGKVYSFEFIPENIEIWKKNVELNPNLSSIIKLVNKPLWSSSNIDLFYKENGPASTVSFAEFDGYDGIVKTISIDDFVNELKLERVDFVKLDIEGAELSALNGATETLRKFKPKLAVALYHSPKDFHSIPKFLNELGIGYKFYLSHATIHSEETMLFAITSND